MSENCPKAISAITQVQTNPPEAPTEYPKVVSKPDSAHQKPRTPKTTCSNNKEKTATKRGRTKCETIIKNYENPANPTTNTTKNPRRST